MEDFYKRVLQSAVTIKPALDILSWSGFLRYKSLAARGLPEEGADQIEKWSELREWVFDIPHPRRQRSRRRLSEQRHDGAAEGKE